MIFIQFYQPEDEESEDSTLVDPIEVLAFLTLILKKSFSN